jgi:hypothetical protein
LTAALRDTGDLPDTGDLRDAEDLREAGDLREAEEEREAIIDPDLLSMNSDQQNDCCNMATRRQTLRAH